MPEMRLHLNIREQAHVIHDVEGAEYPSVEAAVAEAIQSAREILAERLRFGEAVDLHSVFEIEDDAGTLLRRVTFEEALSRRAAYRSASSYVPGHRA